MKKTNKKITAILLSAFMLLSLSEPLYAAQEMKDGEETTQQGPSILQEDSSTSEEPTIPEDKNEEETTNPDVDKEQEETITPEPQEESSPTPQPKEKFEPKIDSPLKQISDAASKATTTDQKWFTFSGNMITAYSASLDAPKDIVIPNTYEKDGLTYDITSIGDNAFAGQQVTSIVLNDNLTTIGYRAFYNNASITNIVIPDSVTSVGKNVFESCAGLTSVTLGQGMKSISDNMFKGTGLTAIVMPNSVVEIGISAFANCKELTTVTLSPNTTTIKGEAFSHCEKLTAISLPNTVTTLGANAFEYCSVLAEVKLSNKIKILENNTFYSCKGLIKMEIPDSVTSIGKSVFLGCSNLGEISIGSGVTTIGDTTFAYTKEKIKIRFKTQKVNSISGAPWGRDTAQIYWKNNDDSCFYIKDDGTITGFKPLDHGTGIDHTNSQNHTIVSIPENIGGITVTTIGKNAFSSSEITEVILPASVTTIEDSAFAYSKSLEKVTLSPALKSVGASAFNYCLKLNDVILGANIETIGVNAFENTENGIKIHLDEKTVNSISGSPWGARNAQIYWKSEDESCFYTDGAGKILGFKPVDHGDSTDHANSNGHTIAKIPSSINGVKITCIGKEAFKGSTITSVDIPSTVTSIEDSAFSESALTSITLPSSISQLGKSVFNECKSLKSAILPDNMTEISNEMFYSCSMLTSVHLPTELKTIGDSAFNLSGISNLTIPNKVETIQKYAFANTKSLLSITLPVNVQNVGTSAFQNSGVQNVVIKNSSINYESGKTFNNCNKLTDINLPKEMKEIPDTMFGKCPSLKSIVLPADLEKISNSAFANSGLTEISIPEGVTSIGTNAFYNTNIVNIDFPDNVRSLGNQALSYCEKLVSVKLPKHLTNISPSMFSHDSLLKNIIIPDSVTEINNSAFSDCTSLENIVLPAGLTRLYDSVFKNCSMLDTLTLPEGLKTIGNTIIDGTNISEIIIPSTVISATTTSLSGLKGNIIRVNQVRDSSSIKSTQPWGVTSATVQWRGEYTSIVDDTIYTPNFGEATMHITITAPSKGMIKTVTFPDGTEKNNIDQNSYEFDYVVAKNGIYGFSADTNSGAITSLNVVIDKIVYATISANGFSLTLDEVSSLTSDTILTKAKASAVKNYDNSKLTVNVSTSLDAIKKALDSEGKSTIITLYSNTTIPNTTEVVTVEKNITLYVLKEYTVTFKDWNGEVLKTQSVYEGDSATPPSANPKRLGYKFTGWDKELSGIHENTEITAQYSPNSYTVKYNTNGGTPAVANKTVGYFDTGLLPTTTVGKVHYEFSGWAKSGGSSITSLTKYSDLVNDDTISEITLNAIWNPIIYHVSFDVNGGTGSKENIDFDADHRQVNLGTTTMKKVGHTFEGWNTEANGTGTSYSSNDVFTPELKDITLFAQWKEQKASYYIAIPSVMKLEEESKDSQYVSKEAAIKIIDENVETGTMRDAAIEVYCDTMVELTNPETENSYKAYIYDASGKQYTDKTNPLMILSVRSTKEKKFMLKTKKNNLVKRAVYQGNLTFTVKFGG